MAEDAMCSADLGLVVYMKSEAGWARQEEQANWVDCPHVFSFMSSLNFFEVGCDLWIVSWRVSFIWKFIFIIVLITV